MLLAGGLVASATEAAPKPEYQPRRDADGWELLFDRQAPIDQVLTPLAQP